jgi:hypothetical protein
MAEFGVDLGNPGSNSSGYPVHYNWAKDRQASNLVQAMVD